MKSISRPIHQDQIFMEIQIPVMKITGKPRAGTGTGTGNRNRNEPEPAEPGTRFITVHNEPDRTGTEANRIYIYIYTYSKNNHSIFYKTIYYI